MGKRTVLTKVSSSIFRLSVLLFSTFVSLIRVKQQIKIGPDYWDIYPLLANAMYFAGKSIGYTEFHRPPFLSLATSVFFRLGFTDESTIFIVCAVFYIIGGVYFYRLIRLRFSEAKSLFATVIYLLNPLVVFWGFDGMTDVPAVAISIVSLYYFVVGLEENSYKLSFSILLVLFAFLTRITSALMFIPFLFCLLALVYLDKKKEIASNYPTIKIINGLILCFLAFIPYGYFYAVKANNPFFHFRLGLSPSLEVVPDRPSGYAVYPEFDYYFTRLIQFLGHNYTMGLIFIILTVIGLLFLFSRPYTFKNNNKVKYSFFILISAVAFIYLFYKFHFSASVFFMLAFVIMFQKLFGEDDKELSFDLLFLCLLGAFLIAHSKLSVKVERYFVTMVPGFAYFIMRGVDGILQFVNKAAGLRGKMDKSLETMFLLAFLVPVVFFSLPSFLNRPPGETYLWESGAFERGYRHFSVAASSWLKDKEGDISDLVIYSDLWPFMSWYLKKEVKPMPEFKKQIEFEHHLLKNDADYYFALVGEGFTYYHNSMTFWKDGGPFFVYERRDKIPVIERKGVYIGSAWHNYLESVLDYEYFIYYFEGYYSDERLKSSLDAHTVEELSEYPVLFLYKYNWESWKNMLETMNGYLENGGSIVIDTSGNMDSISNSFKESSLFGKLIDRYTVDKNAKIKINSPMLEEVQGMHSEFVDENGGSWYGSSYKNVEQASAKNEEVLAYLGKQPLIIKQKVGKGHIFWISSNFVWHSFITKNKSEQRLVKKIVDIAYEEAVKNQGPAPK